MGSTQAVIIVLDNWEAKVVGWVSFPPVFFVFRFFHFDGERRKKPSSLISLSAFSLKKTKKTKQGPTPVYRAPQVGFTFSWGFYEYLW